MFFMDSSQLGHFGEELASQYLECVKGWRIIGKRVRFYRGEIDLIAEDFGEGLGGQVELRFVEVKCRRSTKFGGVVEGLTAQKLTRIWRAICEWRKTSGDFRSGKVWFVGVSLRSTSDVAGGYGLDHGTTEIEEWEVG